MKILQNYWWVLLLIALLIVAYIYRNTIISWFGFGGIKIAGTDVLPGESCASPQKIAQRAALLEGEDDCPKPLYAAIGNAKERYWTKGPNWFDSCISKIVRDIDGSGPWYFNYEKGDKCYYINDISNPLAPL